MVYRWIYVKYILIIYIISKMSSHEKKCLMSQNYIDYSYYPPQKILEFFHCILYSNSSTPPLQDSQLNEQSIFHDICVLIKSTHISTHHGVNFHFASSSPSIFRQLLWLCCHSRYLSEPTKWKTDTEILFLIEHGLHCDCWVILYLYY